INLLRGHDAEIGNFLTEFGESIKQAARDFAPVYTREMTDQGIRGLDFGENVWEYIFSNLPTLGSTLALLVPAQGVGFGVGRLAGMITRGASTMSRASRLARMAAEMGNAGRAAHILEIAGQGSRA